MNMRRMGQASPTRYRDQFAAKRLMHSSADREEEGTVWTLSDNQKPQEDGEGLREHTQEACAGFVRSSVETWPMISADLMSDTNGLSRDQNVAAIADGLLFARIPDVAMAFEFAESCRLPGAFLFNNGSFFRALIFLTNLFG
ncbi:hypothetical protein [Rhizobium herbae]|uniref:Uncharacterized protein n=1 Tax=Rhizobium herbae TaxID=508661 RepID=A0ABS4EQR9_9HYPH|nr:hypothetical protein [Rhizobium herbae]MBP1860292.1 hypothetical protein [Rhizobium herbae]